MSLAPNTAGGIHARYGHYRHTESATPGCLFVALERGTLDAHDFADKAKQTALAPLLVSRPLDIDLPQVIVKDTRQAFFVLNWPPGTYGTGAGGGA